MWHKRFWDGRQSTSDDERSGRTSLTDRQLGKSFCNIDHEDRRPTIRELERRTGFTLETVNIVLKEERLNMKNVCTRWIPRLLSLDGMLKRVAASTIFLSRAELEGDSFLERIITTNEKVQIGKDQEKAQSAKDSHSKNPRWEKTKLTIRYLYHENIS